MPLYHYLALWLEKPVYNHCVAWCYVIDDSKKKKLSSCCWSTQQTSRIVYWWPLRSLPITREVASKRCPFVVWYHTVQRNCYVNKLDSGIVPINYAKNMPLGKLIQLRVGNLVWPPNVSHIVIVYPIAHYCL